MPRKKRSAEQMDWKALIAGQEDFQRPLIQQVIQQVLEAEMEEVPGAAEGERTETRLGHRSSYHRRTLAVWSLPNEASCLRRTRARAAEMHENRIAGTRDLNMEDLREHKREQVRRAAG